MSTSYRPIRPLPQNSDDDGQVPEWPRKKRVIIAQACHFCRKKKAKCDGARPRCHNCVTKDRECTYDGDEGQSRPAALKARIQSLEKLVGQLQAEQPSTAGSTSTSDQQVLTPVDGTTGHVSKLSARLSFPTASATKPAIDGFFNCSGRLFHVFSQAQVSEIFQSVFQSQEDPDASCDRKSDLCCLMAVAAVGFQYSQHTSDQDVEDLFYCLAQHHFDDVIETRPMDAIKVCTLFGMYNIFRKATASLVYVDIGLGMCHRYGFDYELRRSTTVSDSMWYDYRKTWRTLIFLSTWLSATLGYKSGNEELLEGISLSQLEIGDSSDISEIIQTEMAKVAMLKARILRIHVAFKDLTVLSVRSIMQDLQSWYEKIPPVMHIESVGQDSLPAEARRSICHIHLLYLGANILLFRRIASQLVRSSARGVDQGSSWRPCENMLKEHSERALLAANSSARIVKMLLDSNGVYKRCWLVIFQTYTSCVIILHAISQKQASSLDPSTWEDDMENARLCLETLKFCGSLDHVAATFHERLLQIYEVLLNYPQSRVTASCPPGEANQWSYYASETPISAQGRSSNGLNGPPRPRNSQTPSQLSFDLLELLCRPFGNPSDTDTSQDCLASGRYDPSRYEHPQLVTQLEWDFESKAPFVWNTRNLGIEVGEVSEPIGNMASLPGLQNLRQLPCSRFLDSTRPSGWAPL